jgi:hypothetical protein
VDDLVLILHENLRKTEENSSINYSIKQWFLFDKNYLILDF